MPPVVTSQGVISDTCLVKFFFKVVIESLGHLVRCDETRLILTDNNPRCKIIFALTCVCHVTGDSAAVPRSSESHTREGRLHHVWLLEAAAYVPHGVPRHDQPGPVPRFSTVIQSYP